MDFLSDRSNGFTDSSNQIRMLKIVIPHRISRFISWTTAVVCLAWSSGQIALAGDASSSNDSRAYAVIFITVDGLRATEVLAGVDPLLLKEDRSASGIASDEALQSIRSRFWHEQEEVRREKLLPYFWGEWIQDGALFGSLDYENGAVQYRNPQKVSYPGYSELLTGRVIPRVIGNRKIQNPEQTILEFVKNQKGWTSRQVAVFASWDVFPWISMSEPGAVFCNAGYMELNLDWVQEDPAIHLLNKNQTLLRTPWDSVRHDVVTAELALAYLEKERPRMLYLSLGETDDWAHERRYDRVLEMAEYFDQTLQRLWNWTQSNECYRDRTLFIVTSDHGRGQNEETWIGHGRAIPEAANTWVAIRGPGAPARGEVKLENTLYQTAIAPTIAWGFGLDPQTYYQEADMPIPVQAGWESAKKAEVETQSVK